MKNSKSKIENNLLNYAAPQPIGLIDTHTKDLIPLILLDALIEIQENYAKVSLSQHYVNPSDKVIDCSFNFPKTDDAVFHSLKVKQGNDEIIAIVDSKVKARAQYKEANETGKTCVLGEVGDKFLANNVVTTKIGNFMPGEKMIITYSYLEKLTISMNRYYKFILPVTLTMRYSRDTFLSNILNKVESQSNKTIWSTLVENPNLIKLEENNEFSDEYKNSKVTYVEGEEVLSYTWNVKTIINSSSPIGNIQVTSGHSVVIDYSSDSKQALVILDTEKSKIPNADYVLLFETLLTRDQD